jgi:hypothetical protein
MFNVSNVFLFVNTHNDLRNVHNETCNITITYNKIIQYITIILLYKYFLNINHNII